MPTLLRLIGAGQGSTDPPIRRKGIPAPALHLTPEEAHNVRLAIRNIARTFGSLRKLAAAIGARPNTFSKKHRPSAGLALAVARVAGISLDAMLRGNVQLADRCPACGAKREGGAS